MLAFGLLPQAHCQINEVNGVTAELSLARNELLPMEDMQLKVRIVNRSGQDLTLGNTSDWISFTIRGESNTVAAQLDAVPSVGEFTMHSAQAGSPVFNLTPCFNFRQVGHYTVAAVINLPAWNKNLICKPINFEVINGVRIPNMPEMQVGVPALPGASDAPPETRKYFLLKVNAPAGMKLYCQLTDETGSRTVRVFPIGGMLSLTVPEVQIDRFSNLHVLHQNGARSFNYCTINPLGQILENQTYVYAGTRPVLRGAPDGRVVVAGGERKYSPTDLPPSDGDGPASAAAFSSGAKGQ